MKKNAKTTDNEITAHELSDLTGLTDRRHRQLAADGFFPAPANGIYKRLETLAGLFRYYQDREHRVSAQLASVKLEREKDKARQERITADTMEGKMVELAEAKRVLTRFALANKQKLVMMPERCAFPLSLVKDPVEIEERLRKEVTMILTDLFKGIWGVTTCPHCEKAI